MLREFRFAARAPGRGPHGAAAILTLSVAIGTAVALASIVRAATDGGAAIPEGDRVARIYAASPALGVERGPVSFAEFAAIQARASAFESVAAYAATGVTLGLASPADTAPALYVSPQFLPLMRARPLVGRTFAGGDADASAAIVSERLWRGRLHGGALQDATLTVDGTPRRIVGVLPRAFSHAAIGLEPDVWLPLGTEISDAPVVVGVIGRLRPGAAWPAAGAELEAIARSGPPTQWTWRAIPVRDDTRSRARSSLALTLLPAVVVLIAGCVNGAVMLMARGAQRHAELSLRQALGATRRRLARDLFVEHAALAAVAAGGGAAVAFALLRTLSDAIGAVQPPLAERIATGPALLGLSAGAAILACALFGVVPALWLSKRRVKDWLRGLPPPGRVRLTGYGARDLVVFIELACASVLVVAAAMWLHFSTQLQRVTLGFPAAQVVGVKVRDIAADAVAYRLASVPGVTGVTRTAAPLGGRGSASIAQAAADGRPPIRAAIVPVGDRFLETLGLPVIRGRSFAAREIAAHARAAVLSESAARALFGDADPLGARVTFVRRDGEARVEVIGICRDAVDYGALAAAGIAQPDVYVPFETLTGDVFLLARVEGDARAMLHPIAGAARIEGLSRQPQPVVLEDGTRFVAAENLLAIRAFGAFALLALLLAGTAVYAVTSHSLAIRSRELGIRVALGAAPARVLSLVLSREAPLIASALGIGILFTVAVAGLAFPNVVAISARSASTWIRIVALCGGTGLVACALAAWPIARLDPSAALRRG